MRELVQQEDQTKNPAKKLVEQEDQTQNPAKKTGNQLQPPCNWPKESIAGAVVGGFGEQAVDITWRRQIIGCCCFLHIASPSLHHFINVIFNRVLSGCLTMLMGLKRCWGRNLRLAVFPKGFESSNKGVQLRVCDGGGRSCISGVGQVDRTVLGGSMRGRVRTGGGML